MKAILPADDRAAARPHPAVLPADEQRWVMQYLPLVKRIVNQLSLQANQVLDREDMEQIGLMGLLEGLRRYGEPDEHFARFAALRIRGAILDELRRQDWRPRQIRQQVHKFRDAVRKLSLQLGRPATEEEIQQYTGLTAEEYQSILMADTAEAIESLDELLQEGLEAADDSQGVEERVVSQKLLEQALSRLDERERLVLTLYYQYELSLKEIALVLEVSDARVCQISKQALSKAARFLTRER
ncbi:MAG: FliA/WhiG family RNA polymerase sigma factor [Xanthomonadaceae bacterium]|nr:FliA/WhiG family RNA polymerase sigma factor [Xanthomonadaceae bacterium]